MIGSLLSVSLFSPVFAGMGAEPLDALLADTQRGAPSLALVCSPVSSVVARLGAIVDHPLSVEASLLGPSPILDLLSNEDLIRAGLRPEGQVSLELWPQGAMRLLLPFDGDEHQLAELMQLFSAATLGEFLDGSGQLEVRFGEPEASGVKPLPGLFEGLPELPGCAVYMARQTQGAGPLQQGQIAFVLDLEAGSGVLRAGGGPELPDLEVPTRSEGTGSSLEKPEALLILGVSLEELIERFWDTSADPIPAAHRRQVRRLGVAEGTTFALYDALGSRDFAAVIPLRKRFGLTAFPRRTRGRLEKMFEVQEFPCESRGGRRFFCQVQDVELHVQVDRSLIVFASSEELGQEVVEGQGTPWSEELPLPQEGSFLVLAAMDLKLPESGERVVARMGARLDGQFIETHFTIDANLAWILLADRLARENHARVLEAYRQRGWTEIAGVIDEIYAAMVHHKASHNGFLELKPAPRSIDALTADPVEWNAPRVWESLDWSTTKRLHGVYWVELLEDGASFTVHGACDSDGDGIAAHFSRTLEQPLVQHSRPEVY